ncbi:leucine-rich repeat-containing protein 74A isoform X2 [Magallana gigas]|uniref:leucine-rich repeat-containing protein 74A isoform X2 n=1 Tax=Magallana gigas TaxID=29159 RepID=UPI0005C36AB5|eukprot:XP_011427896.1 PREDICTED: leucine-rich repeat-containing protein 74A isoform X2 [Crassostrea gigas]
MEQESSEKENTNTGKAVKRWPIESQEEPISVIREETEEELKAATDQVRPVTSKGRLQTHFPQQSRPSSSKKYPRPGSTRSTGSSRPGTGSRKTVSRASSRKSRPESSGSRLERFGPGSDHSESDDEIPHKPREHLPEIADFTTVDINDEKAFDTDLEDKGAGAAPGVSIDLVADFQYLRTAYAIDTNLKFSDNLFAALKTTTAYDPTGRTAYIEGCKKVGVVPASYFLRHMNDPHLSMKHHGLGSQGMRAIAMSLVSNTSVLTLDLSDNWLGHPGGHAVCEMLRDNCFITHLDLSDNKFGLQTAESLSQTLQQNSTLTHVTLSGNDFDDKAAVHFSDAIMNTTKLEYLNLSHNLFGENAGIILGPAIADNSSLKELDLSWNSIRRKGAVAIAQGIKNNVYMKKINLAWNGFGLEGSIAFGDALKGNQVLEELDLTNNRITSEGAVLIGKGVSVNETLTTIRLGRNPMQTAGCYGICAAILRNPNCALKELDFKDILVNKDFDDIFKQVQEQVPDIKMRHGGMEPPKKPRARIHPMVKLTNYIEKNNLRLVDFFNKFDKDGSMSVTYEEFQQGIEDTGIKLTQEEVQILLSELDSDGDGEINFSEMVSGHTGFQESQQENINVILTATQPRPVTT